MKLKYLVYMLSFLALIGMVSAGTYTEVNYNGMFKVAEVKSLDSKFDKSEKKVAPQMESYTVETSYMMKPYAGYQTCYRNNDKGCITCEGTLLNDGYGQVTNYDGAGMVKSPCAKTNRVNGYSQSAFRDDYKTKDCSLEFEESPEIVSVKQFGTCGNYY